MELAGIGRQEYGSYFTDKLGNLSNSKGVRHDGFQYN
jgi:hypothetical protein